MKALAKAAPARAKTIVLEKPRPSAAAEKRKARVDTVDAELVDLAQSEGKGREDLVVPTEEMAEGFTTDGRYIPYGGGLMGWFDNSGVLKIEKENKYQFFTVVDSDSVRGLQFKRWGQGFNRRGDRARVRKETQVTINWGEGRKKESCHGKTKDISMQGMRLQIFEDISLKKGSEVEISLSNSAGGEVVTVSARVVWLESVGRIRPVVNVGIGFEDLVGEGHAALKEFLQE